MLVEGIMLDEVDVDEFVERRGDVLGCVEGGYELIAGKCKETL